MMVCNTLMAICLFRATDEFTRHCNVYMHQTSNEALSEGNIPNVNCSMSCAVVLVPLVCVFVFLLAFLKYPILACLYAQMLACAYVGFLKCPVQS